MMDLTALEFGRAVFDLLFMSSVRAVALILPVLLTLALIRPRRPALEHGVWTAVLSGMLLLPVLGLLSLSPELSPSVLVETAMPVLTIPAWSSAEVAALAADDGSSVDWRGLTGLLSILVTALLLLQSTVLRRRILRLIARADAITEPAAQQLLHSLLGETKLSHPPTLVSSPEVGTPVVFGCFRPTIILPATWLQWSRAKLRAVLLHELSHIARRDGWVMVTASLNTALFWFHPGARWLRNRLRALAEMACDDHAIMVARDPESYAETLLEIAKCCRDKGALPATTPAMAHTPRVTRRIERILRTPGFHSGMLLRTVRRRLALAVLSATILISLVSVTLGQSDGVTLTGSVQDASGARIAEATVLIVDSVRNTTEATTTGADGSYRLDGLAPSATYEIEVSARGFATHSQTVDLTADKRFDVTLEVGRIQEAVVVSGKRPPAGPSQAKGPRKRIRVGGNVQKAKLVKHVSPIYAVDVQQEGVEGTVLLEAVISKEGEPIGLKPINTVVDRRLVTAAIESVSQWRYQPMLLNGQPIEVVTTISVAFQLP